MRNTLEGATSISTSDTAW